MRVRSATILLIYAVMDCNILPLTALRHCREAHRKGSPYLRGPRQAAGGRCGRDRPCRLPRARAAPAGAPPLRVLPGAAAARPLKPTTRRQARGAGAAARRRRARRAAAARTVPAPMAPSAHRRASWRTGTLVGLLAAPLSVFCCALPRAQQCVVALICAAAAPRACSARCRAP